MLNAPTSSIRVIARATAKAGESESLKHAFLEIVERVRQEDGCLGYQLHVDHGNDHRFVMVEIWQDADALTRHAQTAYFQQLLKTIEPLLAESLQVEQFSPIEL
ncbi:putative quinol monooxygenase [Celerinatantimonas yamalensis]|uniref:Quinol monooxygenase n=1 Tax=Celerinatantimonas yamalensis TaxID=559956 RepID=A0ABW9G882_9GAMM